jgi:uncharacterized protein YggU (UPF0235/DUF167 family)
MKIIVKVKTNAREEVVEKVTEYEYAVAVKESPIGGKANIAVIKALAKHFKVSASRVHINAGHASKSKIVEIL